MPRKSPATPQPTSSPEAINEHLGRRVKKLRTERGWSLDNLAAASGVSRSMLSEIEREKANPTLAVTFRIAQAFGMALAELVETPGAAPSIQVVRGDDRSQVFRSDKHHQIRTLSPLHLEKDVEFYEVVLRPGGVLRSSAHFGGTREFVTVQQGTVRVRSNNDQAELNRLIAVGLRRLGLHDHARAGLDHRRRMDRAIRVEDLGHADFFSDDACHHFSYSLASGFRLRASGALLSPTWPEA